MNRLCCPCCGVNGCRPELVMALTDLEAAVGPLQVTSSYRCKAHNDALRAEYFSKKAAYEKGDPNVHYPGIEPALHSQHLLGNAIDVHCPKPKQPLVIKHAGLCGFRGIGVGGNFLHLDHRQVPASWVYK